MIVTNIIEREFVATAMLSLLLLTVVVVAIYFTLTDRASTIPSNIRGCRSGTSWSQRGTKVNGSHHGDNPLLRPTGIQIATKCYWYVRLYKQWHRPIPKRFIKPPYSISRAASIDSDCCRHSRPAFSATNRTNYIPTSFDQVQVSQGHTSYKNKEN